MPDNVPIIDANGTSRPIAADEVTDGALGTVDVQYLKIMDGTLNGTSKAAVSNGALLVQPLGPSTPVTPARKSVTNTNTNLLVANTNRVAATLYNEGGAVAYVLLGTTATTTNYTLQLPIGAYYEVVSAYRGNIDAITSSGTATVMAQEYTA